MRSVALLVLTLATVRARADVSAIYGDHSPRGSLSSTRPVLSWVVTPTGGGKVTRVEMTVNSRRVDARFNDATSAIEFMPDTDLNPGLYCVDCRATIEGRVVVRQDWSFEIASVNDSSFSAATIVRELNAIRQSLGLPAYRPDRILNQAAAAHTAYQSANGVTGHFEQQGGAGFTGEAPWDRAQKLGYAGSCFEVASGGISDPIKALHMLFDAPYHRIAFLQPGATDVGVGFDGQSLTVDCGVASVEGAGMSPAPEQRDVPVQWDGNETPSPLRAHGTTGPVGYPIVFGWYSSRLEDVRILSMRLMGPDGKEVDSTLNTPSNDTELRFAAVLIPRRKLLSNATFTVEVRAATQRGVEISRTWRFMTARSAVVR